MLPPIEARTICLRRTKDSETTVEIGEFHPSIFPPSLHTQSSEFVPEGAQGSFLSYLVEKPTVKKILMYIWMLAKNGRIKKTALRRVQQYSKACKSTS